MKEEILSFYASIAVRLISIVPNSKSYYSALDEYFSKLYEHKHESLYKKDDDLLKCVDIFMEYKNINSVFLESYINMKALMLANNLQDNFSINNFDKLDLSDVNYGDYNDKNDLVNDIFNGNNLDCLVLDFYANIAARCYAILPITDVKYERICPYACNLISYFKFLGKENFNLIDWYMDNVEYPSYRSAKAQNIMPKVYVETKARMIAAKLDENVPIEEPDGYFIIQPDIEFNGNNYLKYLKKSK